MWISWLCLIFLLTRKVKSRSFRFALHLRPTQSLSSLSILIKKMKRSRKSQRKREALLLLSSMMKKSFTRVMWHIVLRTLWKLLIMTAFQFLEITLKLQIRHRTRNYSFPLKQSPYWTRSSKMQDLLEIRLYQRALKYQRRLRQSVSKKELNRLYRKHLILLSSLR